MSQTSPTPTDTPAATPFIVLPLCHFRGGRFEYEVPALKASFESAAKQAKDILDAHDGVVHTTKHHATLRALFDKATKITAILGGEIEKGRTIVSAAAMLTDGKCISEEDLGNTFLAQYACNKLRFKIGEPQRV